MNEAIDYGGNQDRSSISGIIATMNVKKCTIPAADEYPRKQVNE
jgi:hypothetical protein